MTHQQMINALIEAGLTRDELKGCSDAEIKALYRSSGGGH